VRVWRYVIRNDDGSLAICKPKIRKGANPGDLVLAFAGRELGRDPHRVVWAGRVIEKLTLEEYWADVRFQCKKPNASHVPDNIYRPGPRGLRQVTNPIHDQNDAPRDCGGFFALVMDPVWRLNREASSLPDQFDRLRIAMAARRGHRISDLAPSEAAELLAWIRSRA
jgi:hypothetical protein